MIRILYIARYHTPMMERKIALLATQSDLQIHLLRPDFRRDEPGEVSLIKKSEGYSISAVRMVGKIYDPHRVLYGSASFTLRKNQPDFIHVEEEPDSLAALQIALARKLFAPRTKLILHTWQNINRPRRKSVLWVRRFLLRQADAILCANREALSILDHLGYTKYKALIPPQGVDIRTFHPPQSKVKADVFRIVYAGRLVPEKGLDTLIEAISHLPPGIHLSLIGNGYYRETLEAKARELKLVGQVQFVPTLTARELSTQFQQTDVLVLPSRSTPVWKEQFGRILIEAMACKVAVVGSNSGAIPEVIGDAGLIFPEGDAVALAGCLRWLMESPDLRDDLIERGFKRVTTHYSQDRIAEQTAKFYRKLAGKGVNCNADLSGFNA